MPLVFLAPLLSGAAGFVGGWFVGDKFGWLKWVIFAAVAFFAAKKLGVV